MRIVISSAARADLEDIYTYGIVAFGISAADKRIAQLTDAILGLADFAESHPVIHDHPVIRRLTLKPHLVLYTIERTTLTVARIVDGRRNMSAILDSLVKL